MNIFDNIRVATKLIALQRSQWWSAETIRDFQERKLLQQLKFATAFVAYYRSLGIRATDIVTAADLQRFPILSKQMQQVNQSSLLVDGATLDSFETSTTSGSTGEPTTVAFDRQSWLLCKYALKIRRMLAFNIGVGKRVLQVSELHPDEIAADSRLFGRDLVFGQRFVSIHDPVHMAIPVLREYRPHAIYALPSFLAELLEYCERHGVSLPQIDVIFTSSEVLGNALRKRLAEVFGASICDVYGSTEFKEVAWQCEHEHYHINFESTWVEIDEAIEGDGYGAVLLTTLVNRAMPLIRYRVGDRGRMGIGQCDCGREGPWIKTISGREVDMIELPNGRKISPYLLTSIIETDPSMRRYQIVQVGPSRLEVRYLSLTSADVDERQLTRSLIPLLDGQMQIQFRHVDDLPRTPRGKQKVFYCDFDAGYEKH